MKFTLEDLIGFYRHNLCNFYRIKRIVLNSNDFFVDKYNEKGELITINEILDEYPKRLSDSEFRLNTYKTENFDIELEKVNKFSNAYIPQNNPSITINSKYLYKLVVDFAVLDDTPKYSIVFYGEKTNIIPRQPLYIENKKYPGDLLLCIGPDKYGGYNNNFDFTRFYICSYQLRNMLILLSNSSKFLLNNLNYKRYLSINNVINANSKLTTNTWKMVNSVIKDTNELDIQQKECKFFIQNYEELAFYYPKLYVSIILYTKYGVIPNNKNINKNWKYWPTPLKI